MEAEEKPATVFAQTVWDKPAQVWRVQLSEGVFVMDLAKGEPRSWLSYSEADRQACVINRAAAARRWT